MCLLPLTWRQKQFQDPKRRIFNLFRILGYGRSPHQLNCLVRWLTVRIVSWTVAGSLHPQELSIHFIWFLLFQGETSLKVDYGRSPMEWVCILWCSEAVGSSWCLYTTVKDRPFIQAAYSDLQMSRVWPALPRISSVAALSMRICCVSLHLEWRQWNQDEFWVTIGPSRGNSYTL
jgi:hypothetical protein